MTGSVTRIISRITGIVCLVAVLGMAVLVVSDAVMRGVFGSPVGEVLPIVQYWAMPVIVFVGFVLAQFAGRHLDVDLLFSSFPPAARRIAGVMACLLSAVTAFAIAFFSIEHASEETALGSKDPVTRIATWPTAWVVPITTAILGVLFLIAARRVVKGENMEPSHAHAGEELL